MAQVNYLNSTVAIPNADALGLMFLGDIQKPNLPFMANIVGLYMFSATESSSLINHVNPNLPLTKIGSPTFTAAGAICSRGNGFDTGLVPTTDWTIMALFQAGDNLILNGGIIASTLTPAALAGTTFQRGDQLSINANNTGQVAFYADMGGTANIQGVAGDIVIPASGPVALLATRRSTRGADLAKAASGANTFNTTYGGTGAGSRTIYNATLRLGMSYDPAVTTAYNGKVIFKGFVVWNTSFTQADMTTILASERTVATTVGMTI